MNLQWQENRPKKRILNQMKNSTLGVITVALWTTCSWNTASAQNEPPASPPLPATPAEKPLHEQTTAEAWAAYQAGENQKATTNADQCIARFGEAANRSQAALEEENVTLPKGKVSEAEANRIRQYQILHDVAACFLIKGWAEERLGRREEARKAYTEARKYTLARSSMPSGESFWSPAEKASESAAKLEKAPSQ